MWQNNLSDNFQIKYNWTIFLYKCKYVKVFFSFLILFRSFNNSQCYVNIYVFMLTW